MDAYDVWGMISCVIVVVVILATLVGWIDWRS